MSTTEVHNGFLRAYERREKAVVLRTVVVTMLVGILPALVLYTVLLLRCTWLASENARLREVCELGGGAR